MQSYFGMKVVVNSDLEKPKLSIREGFKHCTDAFRQEMNEWLANRFGVEAEAYVLNGNTLVMGPKAYLQIKKQVEKESITPAYPWDNTFTSTI